MQPVFFAVPPYFHIKILSGNLIAQQDGLPNITGNMSGNGLAMTGAQGAFKISSTFYALGHDSNATDGAIITFDASMSNPIYGQSAHVTPENYTAKLWLRIA